MVKVVLNEIRIGAHCFCVLRLLLFTFLVCVILVRFLRHWGFVSNSIRSTDQFITDIFVH